MSDVGPAWENESQLAESRSTRRAKRRDRVWWAVVLLLLLLLVVCGILHALFPERRVPPRVEPTEGLTPVFSVYGLTEPRGVGAGPDGEIVIADTGAQRAYVYDRDGVLTARLGGDEPEDKVFSVAQAFFEDDTIYLCDWGLQRIWLFRGDGTVVDYFPEDPTPEVYGPGGFFPFDVIRYGPDILVANRTGLFTFDGSTFELNGRFDQGEPGGHAPDYMTGVTTDPESGRVWAVDSFNRRVIAYDSDGRAQWLLGRPDEDGRIVSFFGLPRSILFTERGLLVSDAFRHEIYLIDPDDGTYLGSYGSRGVVDGEFNFPEGMALAPDGLLYVADRVNDRVQVLEFGDPMEPRGDVAGKWEQNFERLD